MVADGFPAAFYRRLRQQDDLGHEDALRDTLVSVLLSPHFCYRYDLGGMGPGVQPLSDYALASRLSYFLWSSMPDAELLAHAAAGPIAQAANSSDTTRAAVSPTRSAHSQWPALGRLVSLRLTAVSAERS